MEELHATSRIKDRGQFTKGFKCNNSDNQCNQCFSTSSLDSLLPSCSAFCIATETRLSFLKILNLLPLSDDNKKHPHYTDPKIQSAHTKPPREKSCHLQKSMSLDLFFLLHSHRGVNKNGVQDDSVPWWISSLAAPLFQRGWAKWPALHCYDTWACRRFTAARSPHWSICLNSPVLIHCL